MWPLGILQEAGVKHVHRLAAGEVCCEDLIEMEDALPAWMQQRAVWVIAKSARKALLPQYDQVNRPLLNFESGGMTLLGHPVIVSDVTSLGSDGDVIFGDFSQYVLAVEEEMILESSAHHKFKQARMCYAAHMCIGGRPTLPRAFVKLTAAA
jgi:HK97 family phage major capsid protein